MPRTRFGEWLEARIREKDWTLRQAADAIGVEQSSVSRYINGVATPSRVNLRKIAAYFGIDRDELEALVDAPRRTVTSSAVDQNVEIINWDAMTPEEAKLLQRLLRGALDVYEARERGDA